MTMAHKTITISEEAYESLKHLKHKGESFTNTVLRITRKRIEGNLLEYMKFLKPDEELARNIEEVLQERGRISLRDV